MVSLCRVCYSVLGWGWAGCTHICQAFCSSSWMYKTLRLSSTSQIIQSEVNSSLFSQKQTKLKRACHFTKPGSPKSHWLHSYTPTQKTLLKILIAFSLDFSMVISFPCSISEILNLSLCKTSRQEYGILFFNLNEKDISRYKNLKI